MAGEIYTGTQDEELIQSICLYGLNTSQKQVPKWTVLRIALAKSLQISIPPDDSLDRLESRGSEYRLEQVTGLGKTPDDFNDAICALLSVFHNENLFDNEKRFCQLLQRHIRRGLQEIRSKWRSDDDFHDYLYQGLFVDKKPLKEPEHLTANYPEKLRAQTSEVLETSEVFLGQNFSGGVYSQWNQAVISYFTTGIPQGSQIYLSVDDDVLENIGQNFLSPEIGENLCVDFYAAVKKEVVVDGQIKLSHLQGRDEQGLPKSVAFLSVMVLAAYRMAEDEEVNQSNFFQRFKDILDLNSESSRPRGMKSGEEEPLWQDWALWLRQKGFLPSAKRGEGSRTYINYPISQTLLRQSDKDKLCQIFTEKNWKTQWDAQTLIVRVRQDISNFPKHLQELLSGHQLKLRYEVIAEAIHEVYEQWLNEGCPITLKKAALTPSRHIFAGLYRIEDFFVGTVEYAVFPKQLRKRQLNQIEIQYEKNFYPLIEERPGWYEPMELPISENELENGAKYRVHDSEEIDDLILPQRDFWILVSDPQNVEAADYASWGAPQLGETFILLCKRELLSQLELLQNEELLKWNHQSQPFGDNSDWIELHECMVISPAWNGVFIENLAIKDALQPSIHFSVSFSGGLRVPSSSGAWIVDHPPQVTIFGFHPTVTLKITSLPNPDNESIFKEDVQTNTPISLNFKMPGEYLVEATYASESSDRVIQIVGWDQLSMTALQTCETLSIGDEQICGSVIYSLNKGK